MYGHLISNCKFKLNKSNEISKQSNNKSNFYSKPNAKSNFQKKKNC